MPIHTEATKEDTFIYTPEHDTTEYLITSSGANDMQPEWYNDRLFIQFTKMINKNNTNI